MNPSRFVLASRMLGLRPRVAVTILVIDLISVLFESTGVGMILPVLQFLEAGENVAALSAQSGLWAALAGVYGALGLPVVLPTLLLTSLFLFLLSVAVTYARMVYAGWARFDLIRGARDDMFRRYMNARLAYSETKKLGEVVNDFTVELERAVSCLFEVLRMVGASVLILAYFGLALAVSAPMTLAVLPVIALAVIGVRGYISRSQEVGEGITQANQNLGQFLVERLRSLRLIRLSGTEAAESAAMRRLTHGQFRHYFRIQVLNARVGSVVEFLGVVAIVGFLYLGFRVFGLSFGELGLFLAAMFRLMPRVKELMLIRQTLLSYAGSVNALERRIAEMTQAEERERGRRVLGAPRRAITLEGVTFRHVGAVAPALNGVDLEIPACSIMALVGPSGAGKSTLIDLLPRLRERSSGEIRFDGVSIDEFSLASLREAFAYAPQTPQVFNVTAAEHICYGRPGATREDIEAAARLAGAHDFIAAMPDGYETNVGEDGVRLSGGERQRLDLARTLVRRAPVLMLDEPTSNLDADAEELFRQALRRIRSETDITIILVGHRLTTVGMADRIAVIESGRVSDVGSHAELIARGGWYAQACAKQQGAQSQLNESVTSG